MSNVRDELAVAEADFLNSVASKLPTFERSMSASSEKLRVALKLSFSSAVTVVSIILALALDEFTWVRKFLLSVENSTVFVLPSLISDCLTKPLVSFGSP